MKNDALSEELRIALCYSVALVHCSLQGLAYSQLSSGSTIVFHLGLSLAGSFQHLFFFPAILL